MASPSEPSSSGISDVPNFFDRYVEACEKHGVSPNIDIHIAISKAKSQRLGALKLFLEQLTEADIMPLVDVLSSLENSELNAVDVVHNKEISNGQVLLRILRSLGPKLRLVDLKNISFGRETLRDLFHKGLQCQVLNLSFSRARKLDMIGQFPQLHTLVLDFSMYVTNLPEGCFRAMPNLARLSMRETRIANLWTSCAALSKVPSLIELRFQSCGCCEHTGPCAAMLKSEKPSQFSENGRHVGNAWHMDTTPMNIDDFVSVDSDRSDSSNTDDYVTSNTDDYIIDDLFSDDDSAMMLQPIHTSGEDSSADSEVEQEGHLLETMSVEEDLNYQGDGEYERDHAVDTSDGVSGQLDQSVKDGYGNPRNGLLKSAEDGGETSIGAGNPSSFHLQAANIGSRETPETVDATESTFSSHTGPSFPDNFRVRSMSESSHDEEELQSSTTIQRGRVLLRRGRFHHPSRICYEKNYREFMIARLPGLKVLDNVAVTPAERDKARIIFQEKFEILPNNRSERESIVDMLKSRETSSWIFPAPSCKRRRIGMVGSGRTGVAFTRSMCALKMAACAWPSCVPICKLKKSNPELSRKCWPRQFEYHPTDPSLMVFGTLHGEVVVMNHESDKLVGHVQSTGSSHSILGLCWLNKDPNKLIAGSDNGSLQLYDVNRMRLGRSLSESRKSGFNPVQSRGSPAIYTYERFDQLTSVHINSSDEYFLASGYSRHVGLYDLCTGKQLQIFNDLHQQHINVVKFSHHSPHLFATSSFDKEIKMWDLRQRVTKPLYTVQSTGGNVMVCFSRDDHYLLSSAVDNEVRQHLAVDGRLHMKFDIPPAGSSQNYTRSYYMNGRDYIITGSCEENVVRIHCAQTGRRLRDLALEGRGSETSIYVQSLRGDPFRDFHFSVLAAYFRPHPKSEILKVNLLASNVYRKASDLDPLIKLPAGMGA